MSKRRAVVRFTAALAGVVGLLAATEAAVLAHPDPLFAYHVGYGRLELRSDRPFDFEAGQHLLADVEQRLSKSELNDAEPHAAIIANTEWRRALSFLWNGGAAGLNYYPLTRNVFIRKSDIEADRVYGASGKMAQPPRTLAYYIAHEMGHTLTKERVGGVAYSSMPRWIREGVADYIGFGSKADVGELMKALRSGDPALDPKSGYYARYRLLAAALIEHEHWSMDRLLHSHMTQAEAEKIVLGSER
jgi:hypothetical protein